MIINSVENIWSTTQKMIEVLPILNHEEAKIRLIFQETMSDKAAVIVAKNVDIDLVVVYASEQQECFLLPCCIAVDSNQFIKIKTI